MSKIIELNKLMTIIQELKKQDKKIVFTNGCFDIIHLGHLKLLKECKKYGDILIIGLNSDNSIKKIKGDSRPINNENYRAKFLEFLEFVDYIIIFEEATPLQLIKTIVPDILIKGKGYKISNIVGAKFVKQNNGKVFVIDFDVDISTTSIINKIGKE